DGPRLRISNSDESRRVYREETQMDIEYLAPLVELPYKGYPAVLSSRRPSRYVLFDFKPDEIPPGYYSMIPRPQYVQPLKEEQLKHAE
ncbi:MAG: hypothetical protein M1835_002630, partial [Candelina submexicana]